MGCLLVFICGKSNTYPIILWIKKGILILIVGLSILGIYYVWSLFSSLNTKRVPEAFRIMEEKLQKSNNRLEEIIDFEKVLDSLRIQTSRTQYEEKAKKLQIVSEDLMSHIKDIKQNLTSKNIAPKDYSKMDSPSNLDSLFFDGSGYSETGKAFVEKIDYYKTTIVALFKDEVPQIREIISNKFNQRNDIDDWLEYNYKGFPLIASLTKLTQMQADVKHIEAEILKHILPKENTEQ